MRCAAALVLCLAALGCRSPSSLEARRLPVHVALIPLQEATVGRVTPGEFEGKETRLRLDLDCDTITDAVATALADYCFAHVTRLDPPSADDAFERERSLLAQARERGADWILELALRYDAEVYRKNASTFWLNYPLFLLAGPSNWFVPDVTYLADVELAAVVYDLNAVAAAGGALGDPVAEVISFTARFAGTELTFVERSGGAADYASGILIPSGHLARESADAERVLREDIVEALRVQLVQGFQSRRDDLVRTERIAPLFVVPEDVRIAREGGDLRVQGRVLLRHAGLATGIRAVRLDAGAERVSAAFAGPFDEQMPDYAAYRFDVRVPTAAGARLLRLECEAGSRDKFLRTYTFRIPPEPRSEM